MIRTPFRDHLGLTLEENAKLVQDLTEKYPLGRVGEVEDISAAIAYLADDKRASFLTGVLLNVDGGVIVAGIALTQQNAL